MRITYNYKALLEKDPNFKRWYNNIFRGSPISADCKLRRIGYVCRVYGYTTKQLSKMDGKKAFAVIDDVVTKLEQEGKSGEYQKDYVKALKSWFSHNDIVVTQKIKISKKKKETKTSKEQSPVPEQVRLVLNAGDQKKRVESSLIAFAGLRLESIGDYLGKDGLELRDLPEMDYDNETKSVSFRRIPTQIIVRNNLSKAGHQYITFLAGEGCQYLKEYLELRMRMGESLTPDSPLDVSIKFHKIYRDKHITTIKVSDSIRSAIRDAGFDWRPYILRTYFDTRLMIAEAEGLLIRDWRVFWMGHVGDMEHKYTLNKGKLPEDLIERMREAYAKAAEKHLVTIREKDNLSVNDVMVLLRKEVMENNEFTKEEIEALGDYGKLSNEEFRALVKEHGKKKLGLNGNNQKIVLLEELEKYILEGWEYVRDFPPNKAIIRLPKE